MGKFNKTSITSLRTRLRKNCLSLIFKETTENKECINKDNQYDNINGDNNKFKLEKKDIKNDQSDLSDQDIEDEQISSKNLNPFMKNTEDQELNEIVDLEKKIYEKSVKKEGGKSEPEPLMTLITDTHFLSFQQNSDLFTLLYSSIIFRWIKSEKIIIIVDNVKTGYRLEIFLRNFKINAMYLDPENPINTNVHFAAQFIKGTFPVLITHLNYNGDNSGNYASQTLKNRKKTGKNRNISPEFALEIVDECVIQPSIIFFNFTDPWLIEDHSCKDNVREIIHFMDIDNKGDFADEYSTICETIKFSEFICDKEQFSHLRYRCEDILFQTKKSDIQKTKLKKINLELLHSKSMKRYFLDNPEEKSQVIQSINQNSIKVFKPSVGYLPSYLVHHNNKDNVVKSAIEEAYFVSKSQTKKQQQQKLLNEKWNASNKTNNKEIKKNLEENNKNYDEEEGNKENIDDNENYDENIDEDEDMN